MEPKEFLLNLRSETIKNEILKSSGCRGKKAAAHVWEWLFWERLCKKPSQTEILHNLVNQVNHMFWEHLEL